MSDCKEDKKWKVYIHTSPSNKKYVGITSQKCVNSRWRNGRGYEKNLYFYRAIQKYGWDNFQHKIIAENLTENEAVNIEKTLIKEFKSDDYHYGYNICSGGEGCAGLFGEKNPNYGHKWSDEQRLHMSEYKKEHPSQITEHGTKQKSEYMKNKWSDDNYRKSMVGENATCYGRVRELHPMYGKTGSLNPMSKMVVCLDKKELFVSATDASKHKGVNHSKLCMCCRGERKSCGKDKDGNSLHWQYYDDYLKQNNLTDEEARKVLIIIKEEIK